MIDTIILLFAGIGIATTVTTLGIGGGILWTPLLILWFKLPPQEAVATSLLIQVIGLGSGSTAYLKAGLVRIRLATILFFIALPGVIIGSIIGVQLPQHAVQMGLGIMSLTLAILFVSAAMPLPSNKQLDIDSKELTKILPIPGFFGFLMGLLSVGISEWLIPALRSRLRLSMPEAVGTVIPVMFGLACVAALSHLFLSHAVCWNCFIYGAIGTTIGGQLGPLLSQRLDEMLLKDSFIYLMTLVGIHLLFQSI